MRVRLYVQRMVNGIHCNPHDVVDLPDDEAKSLIAAGSAGLVDGPPQRPAPQADTAPADPPEAG